jgi:hypothetical protein
MARSIRRSPLLARMGDGTGGGDGGSCPSWTGGADCGMKKTSRSHLDAAGGVVDPLPNGFFRSTTPSGRTAEAAIFFVRPACPARRGDMRMLRVIPSAPCLATMTLNGCEKGNAGVPPAFPTPDFVAALSAVWTAFFTVCPVVSSIPYADRIDRLAARRNRHRLRADVHLDAEAGAGNSQCDALRIVCPAASGGREEGSEELRGAREAR